MGPSTSRQLTTDDRLDVIITFLHRMDRRDRLRTIGGSVRGMLSLIPMLLFLWSAWYLYEHGDELLTKIAQESAKQAVQSQQEMGTMLQDLFTR
jgi:hypothetical protein